ncbi:haloacid dehalogenase-like hydrolase, putative [Bodo saltans]|uniref:Haloacid dehalogenase-like hydrolase, putative n=1 Tax=Bodo saltans TaxID=75058 RepID=A0A0S4JWP4_BODSA|nr:haloacid dehalogenase-like hydrolase, putative [Bodo saltans]|eukprot:CUG93845.1 haloacid dehalogenase-like hydrolase, putative [Bodo saltans]
MSTGDLICAAQAVLVDRIDGRPASEDSISQLWNSQHSTTSLHMIQLSKSKRHLAFVFDIEGTTTPLPFVTKVLYPHSEVRLEAFLRNAIESDDPGVIGAAQEAATVEPSIADALQSNNKQLIQRAFEMHLRHLIAANSKASYLKYVQGRIWKDLYEDGTIKGHLFSDAVRCMTRWGMGATKTAEHATTSVWIYSSGSIAAQKLLFGFSSAGDLNPTITGYFDPTTVGPKVDALAYSKIREEISRVTLVSGGNLGVVFFTDHLGEVSAARKSGSMDAVVFVTRPLNNVENVDAVHSATQQDSHQSPVFNVSSFDQVALDRKDDVREDTDQSKLIDAIVSEVSRYHQSAGTHQLKSFL